MKCNDGQIAAKSLAGVLREPVMHCPAQLCTVAASVVQLMVNKQSLISAYFHGVQVVGGSNPLAPTK